MLNCGAFITRTGNLNTSSSLALVSKGINIQRRLSTITRNKLVTSDLLGLSTRLIPGVQNTNAGRVLASHIIVKCIHYPYTRSLCLRKIHTHLRAQCSSCTTDVKKKFEITDVSKQHIDGESNAVDQEGVANFKIKDIFENESEDTTEHRTHKQKKIEMKISDIERLYPSAKGKLNDIYVSVGSQLQLLNPLKIEFLAPNRDRHLWMCTYTLKWPENKTITSTASNKMSAAKMGALKCLLWLHNEGKIMNGHPVVYESKHVVDMLKQTTPLTVKTETLDSVKRLLERYKTEISEVTKDSNDTELIKDISLLEETSSDPVGRSYPDNWLPQNLSRRNAMLKARFEDRLVDCSTKPLPIEEYKERIIHEVAMNRVLLIKGDTGCGKTTQVPQYIMESFESRGIATDCNMIVSQPRKISAISLAERIADERNERAGETVGYQVRLKQVLPQTPGGMLFCTTGILLRKLQSNPTLKGVSHVILDEAHERSINTDMLLVLLKRALRSNNELKVIVMSATINADLFQQYFDCGVVEVPGRTFPVEMNFLEDIERLGVRQRREYVGDKEFPEVPFVDCEQIGELICWIAKNKPPGAILCFLPGWADIVRVNKYLADHRHRYRDMIVPVHSRMAHQDQRKIFQHPPPGVRKIVLATDIAETGITVTDVVYVVDSAIQKAMKWHEKKGLASMDNQYASQANILQRKGRAGRVTAGTSYHLVTRRQFENLDVHPLPEVLRSSLEKTVLDCKTYSDESAEKFLGSMPQPPTLSAVRKAINDLGELGALDQNENLTPLGKRMALFTMHPKLSKAMVYSSIFQCVSPMVTITSAMSAENEIFTGTLYDKETIRKVKQKYHPASDHNSIGWIFTQWASVIRHGRDAAKQFCWSTKLFPERMFTLSKIRDLHAENLAQCRMLNKAELYDDRESYCNEFSEIDELVRGVLLSGLDQLLHRRDFELRKNKVKKGTTVFIMEDGNRATVTPESVNFKRNSWPSPFLTYVRRQHSEERRTSLIRETSMVAPLTVLLFSQGHVHGYQQSNHSGGNDSNNEVVLTIKGRKNVRVSCDQEVATLLLQFRDSMWNVVRYLVMRQGLVEDAPGTNFHKVEEYKQYMLQVLAKMLAEAAETIDQQDNTIKQKSKINEEDDGCSEDE